MIYELDRITIPALAVECSGPNLPMDSKWMDSYFPTVENEPGGKLRSSYFQFIYVSWFVFSLLHVWLGKVGFAFLFFYYPVMMW